MNIDMKRSYISMMLKLQLGSIEELLDHLILEYNKPKPKPGRKAKTKKDK